MKSAYLKSYIPPSAGVKSLKPTDPTWLSPTQRFHNRYPLIYSATARGVRFLSVFDLNEIVRNNYARVASGAIELPLEIDAIQAYLQSVYPQFIAQLEKQCDTLHVCGPAAIALAWILSLKTGLPIGLNLSGDHIEVQVHIYVPSGKGIESEEQTSIKLCLGGREFIVDPTCAILMNDRREIVFQEVAPFEQTLQDRYHLYGVEVAGVDGFRAPALKSSISRELCLVGEAIANTPLALQHYSGVHVGDIEICFKFADSICRLIRDFVPDWNDSMLSQFREYDRKHPAEKGLTLQEMLFPDLVPLDRITIQSPHQLKKKLPE